MKRIIVCLFCIGLSCGLFAQRANYEQAEKAKSNLSVLSWGYEQVTPFFTEGSDDFWFREDRLGEEKYYYVDLKARKVEKFLDPAYLAAEMEKVTGRKYDPKKLGFWQIYFKKGGEKLVWQDGNVTFEYNRKTRKLSHTRDENMQYDRVPRKIMTYNTGMSPDGRYLVFGKDHNAYIRDLQDSTVVQLTFDGIPGYSHTEGWPAGKEVPLAPVWFEDSQNFCLFRQDYRGMGEVSYVNYLKGRPVAQSTQMILAGDSVMPYTEVTVYDVATKTKKVVDIDRWKNQQMRILHSNVKANKLYLERRNRQNTMLDVCEVDVSTGAVKVIIHEEGDPYLGIELASIFFLNDYKDIIWWSERSGYGHLYHYDGEGNLKNTITSGNWTAGKIVGIDEKSRTVYFQAYGVAPGENPSYAKICKANIDGKGKMVVLTPEEGTHNVVFSPSRRYIIDAYSRPDLPYQFKVRDTRNGELVVNLYGQNLDNLYAKGWKMPETFSVKAADGETDLYGVMWKPFDFDSTKSYPIISCVYPGPHTDNVPLSFEIASTNEALAQVGFIVVAFNHRGGLPFRGKAYHTYGYSNIRDHALADDKCGLEQLIARHAFIDGNRVGVYGHSGGGMMSTAAICTYPDFYKACVSSAGNHDNNIYSQFYVESHYAMNGPLPTNMELAKNLKGHLMLVVGCMDGNVHPAHTVRMADAFINHGKDVELVVLPRGRHTYDGVSSWYFERKLRSHFAKYLLGDFESSAFYDIEINEFDQVKK